MSIVSGIRPKIIKIKKIFYKNEDKIILTIGFVLIALISFGFGRISNYSLKNPPLEINGSQVDFVENFLKTENKKNEGKVLSDVSETAVSTNKNSSDKNDEKEKQVVGSVNSKKYHLPDCYNAKKIKQENQIWFSSAEEAKKQGYEPAKCCHPEK
jgi:hypothetical protein